MTRQYLRIGARTIAYLDSAPGGSHLRPYVLLHAFPLGAGMWEPQGRGVPAGWRLIAPDLRGFGGSTDTDAAGRWSMDDYAADAIDLLRELGVGRAVVGGLSMGGYATLAVLRNAPDLVEAVVLADTRAGADSSEGRGNRRQMIALLDREGPLGIARNMVPKLVGPTTRETESTVEATVRSLILQQSPAAIRGALLRMMERPDSTPLVSALRIPALVIVGAEDGLTPVDESQRIADAIPGSTLVVVPRAGHLPNLEQPDAFNGALADFIGRL